MDPTFVATFADFILQSIHTDCVWDPEFQFHLDFESLQLIVDLARTCSLFRTYLHTRVEYFALKLAVYYAAISEVPYWISPAQQVVYQVRTIWSDFKKLQCGPQAAFYRSVYVHKPLAEMSPEELMSLHEELQRSVY